MELEGGAGRATFPNLLDDPNLFRHVLEDLPVGFLGTVVRNGSQDIWGQEVVGHVLEDIVQACDQRGNSDHRAVR